MMRHIAAFLKTKKFKYVLLPTACAGAVLGSMIYYANNPPLLISIIVILYYGLGALLCLFAILIKADDLLTNISLVALPSYPLLFIFLIDIELAKRISLYVIFCSILILEIIATKYWSNGIVKPRPKKPKRTRRARKPVKPKIAAILSASLFVAVYITLLLTLFTSHISTYICYTTRTGECYHAKGCQYLHNSARQTTVYEAEDRYRDCSRCNPFQSRYKTSITERNYFVPFVISAPIGIALYWFLTKPKEQNNIESPSRDEDISPYPGANCI